VDVHASRGQTEDECKDNKQIVKAEFGFEEVFRPETERRRNAGYNTENDSDVDEDFCLVADGNIAVGVGYIEGR
jgi:hypothetical protein